MREAGFLQGKRLSCCEPTVSKHWKKLSKKC